MDGKVVANVSVNRTDFAWDREVKHFLQLGTVMTDEAYRGRGLIRRIVEEIDADYAGRVDGIYFFANNSVLDFYPKFGFVPVKQYEYVKPIRTDAGFENAGADETFRSGVITAQHVPMTEKAQWDQLESLIRSGYCQSSFELLDNTELNMFYVTKYMQDCVYYCDAYDTYVVAELEDGELILNMVISDREQDLNRIVECFGGEIHSVVLGFTPKNGEGFTLRELDPDDRQMFVKGTGFAGFEEAKVMVPLLAHV